MVGQERLKNLINLYIENKTLPRFIFIVGEAGSGRKTLTKYIAERLNCPCIVFDNTVDAVRDVITNAYQQTEPIVYCIPEYEKMSQAAISSLLKVGEETPQQAYIVITAKNSSSILPTLKSRSIQLLLDEYSIIELEQIAKEFGVNTKDIDICSTPGDLLKVKNLNIDEFKAFVDSVWDKLTQASEGNALKIPSKLKIKDDDTKGYDITLFFNYLQNKINETAKTLNTEKQLETLYKILKLIAETKYKLTQNFNKQSIIDLFILKLRKEMYGII